MRVHDGLAGQPGRDLRGLSGKGAVAPVRGSEEGEPVRARMSAGRAWITASACAAVLLPGLAACSTASSGGSTSPAKPAASSAPAAPGTPAAVAAHGPAGLTAPGSRLSFGQTATVNWVPPSEDGISAQRGFKLAITVVSIEKGTIADFKDVQLNSSQRRSVPYYVKVRIKSLGSAPPPRNEDPAISMDAIDDRGQQQSGLIFLGSFPRCNDNTPPKPFVSGKAYNSCLTYLMPGGGSIKRVQWANGPHGANQVTPYFDHPIVWGAG